MITLAQAAKISREKLMTIKPEFAARVRAWVEHCASEGIRVYIYCGYRSHAEQTALYARGRTAPGRKVTNAKAGQSYHNYGRAIDWVPLVEHDRAPGFYNAGWHETAIYKRAQELAANLHLAPLSWETPHLQDAHFPTWQSCQDAEVAAARRASLA